MSKIIKNSLKEVVRLGIDTSKRVFHLHGVNKYEKVVFKKSVSRKYLLEQISQFPPCLIGIEACGASHYWGREFSKFGHTVKLMPAMYVKAYLKNNKNDARDAEAICEAVGRPTMRFVPIKNIRQQDVQALHRVRSEIIKNRTALSNQIRGLLAEYGIILPLGIEKLHSGIPEILADTTNELTPLFRDLLKSLHKAFQELDERMKSVEKKIESTAKEDEIPLLLLTIKGVGFLTATSLYAAIGNGEQFKNSRDLSAWLGLVPRQNSTGGKTVLLGISKKGNKYIRYLFVNGGRSVVQNCHKYDDKYNKWVQELVKRKGFNKAAVAVANKNCRIALAILKSKKEFNLAA